VGKFVISRRNTARGFTLIELLIVIAILGLIAATVVLASQRMTASAAVSAAKSERLMLQKAVDAAMAETGAVEINALVPNGWDGGVGVVTAGTPPVDANAFVKRTPTKGHYGVELDGTVWCTKYSGVTDLTKVNGAALPAGITAEP